MFSADFGVLGAKKQKSPASRPAAFPVVFPYAAFIRTGLGVPFAGRNVQHLFLFCVICLCRSDRGNQHTADGAAGVFQRLVLLFANISGLEKKL